MTADADHLFALIDDAAAEGTLTDESPRNLKLWLTEPCYSAWHARIAELLQSADGSGLTALNEMFWTTIPFGTGGRRGAMGEMGPATINERTIAESAHGLATYMKGEKATEQGRAVVAHDTRTNSQLFARIAATTFAAHGLKVYVFGPHACVREQLGDEADAYTHRSTPLLSFAVRELQCDIGVVISASHNPPADNGFKAYWSDGGQVVPPHDKRIIECVEAAREIPAIDFDEAVAQGLIEIVDDRIDAAFREAVAALSLTSARTVDAVFSPLHGVGETSLYDVVKHAGFAGVRIHEDHRRPDGGFPNVPDHFPNPERPEVFAPVVEAVRESKTPCELILASDPDADRVAISVRDTNGEFVHLTGNQTGALLTDFILRHRSAAGTLTPDHYVVETLVTTPLIASIARSYGVTAITDLLVGFKYIAETMNTRGAASFIFGTEESLGHLAGEYCRDKDASIAALYVLELAAELRDQGQTLLDRLNDLYAEHGVHAESQLSLVCPGSSGRDQILSLMEQIRTAPPETLAGLDIARSRDYARGEVRSSTGVIGSIEQPRGELVFLDTAEGPAQLSVAARPSGTEPKIKFYFFARESLSDGSDVAQTRRQAAERLATAEAELDRWAKSVLATQ